MKEMGGFFFSVFIVASLLMYFYLWGLDQTHPCLCCGERYTAEMHDMARLKYGIGISGLMRKKGYGATALLVPLYSSVCKSTPNF